jgi:hypothetical protein
MKTATAHHAARHPRLPKTRLLLFFFAQILTAPGATGDPA